MADRKTKKRPDRKYEKTINLGKNPDGSYIRKHLYGATKKELEENVRQAINQYDQGVDIINKKPTVKDWADKWLEVYKPGIKRSMRAVYSAMINKWLLPIHIYPIDKVRQVQLQEILLNASKQLAQSSVDKLYNCIRGIFSTANQNGWVSVDVSINVAKPVKGAKTKREALTKDEQGLLEESCKKRSEGALPMIMMYAGLRIGEVLALTWGDIKDGYIRVSKTIVHEENSNHPSIKDSPKSNAGFRSIPIMEPLQPFLDRLKPAENITPLDTTPLFTSKGKLYSKIMKRDLWDKLMVDYAATFMEIWEKKHPQTGEIIETPPVPRKITAHMLRHTYATILYDAGIDIKTAQKWLGDATVSVVMDIYTHLTESKEIEAENKLKTHIKDRNSGDNMATKIL